MANQAVVALSPALPFSGRIELTEAFFAGRNSNTLEAYSADLAHFAAFAGCGDIQEAAGRLLGVSHGEANGIALSYRAALLESGLAPATVNRRLSALRSMVKLANTLGLVPWQLAVGNVRSKGYRDTRGPGRLTFDSALRALARRGDAKAKRDVALIRLMHDLGLRRKEVIGLDLADVKMTPGTVAIVGKGEIERDTLTLPDATKAALAAWIKARGERPGPLFCNFDRAAKGDGRLTGRGVHAICKRLGFRPHGMRHLAITEALDVTKGDVRAVRKFSRHSRIETVLIYDDNRSDMGGQISKMIAGDV